MFPTVKAYAKTPTNIYNHIRSRINNIQCHPEHDDQEFNDQSTANITIADRCDCLTRPVHSDDVLFKRSVVKNTPLVDPRAAGEVVGLRCVEPDACEDVDEEQSDTSQFSHSNDSSIDLEGLNVRSYTCVHLEDFEHADNSDKSIQPHQFDELSFLDCFRVHLIRSDR